MQIDITARHLKLTTAIDAYVHKRMEKSAKFFDEDGARAHVILSIEKSRQITEISFNYGKLNFRAKEQSPDLYSSIDLAVEKLEKQFKKQKEISKSSRKGNLKAIRDKKRNLYESFSYDIMEDSRDKISEIRRFDLKPMSIEEAIENMRSLGYGGYMFLNENSDRINVIYNNNDSLVLLEPNEK